ncbi:MAG: hypothetical protein R3Y43_08115 [Alphaproteobacteria bacterium]
MKNTFSPVQDIKDFSTLIDNIKQALDAGEKYLLTFNGEIRGKDYYFIVEVFLNVHVRYVERRYFTFWNDKTLSEDEVSNITSELAIAIPDYAIYSPSGSYKKTFDKTGSFRIG